MPTLQCEFWNVGQGLFSSGRIQMGDAPAFHWVYDCGSASKNHQNLLSKAIVSMDKLYSTNIIDLMAISHFDEDHINGVNQLLKNKTVRYWLLPYYPLEQRLIIAYLKNISSEDALFEFYLSPIKYLSEHYKIENIVLTFPDDYSKTLDEILTQEEFNNILTNVILYKESELPNVLDIEFFPYNVPFSFVRNCNKRVSGLLNNVTQAINTKPFNIGNVTNVYNNFFQFRHKKDSKYKNIISTFLYIRSLSDSMFSRMCYQDLDGGGWHSNLNNKDAILYSGDGYLKTKKQIDNFEKSLGKDRIAKIACLQVPHHGSHSNWKLSLSASYQPKISIFSADPYARYHHPHLLVWLDFAKYKPILVDTKNHLTITLS